jgi:SAM-dependent methyltransferase
MGKSRPCPVCHTGFAKAKLVIEKNIDPAKLSGFCFASRKEPEFMCHRLVQCTNCDLVYADQPPGEGELAHAYHVADYDSSEEANDAAKAYILAIQPTLGMVARRQSAMEIGTGTGIFLDYLSRKGCTEIIGVEPSSAAFRLPLNIVGRGFVRVCLRKKILPASRSTVICCFMTMEHVRDPNIVASAAFHLLCPRGRFRHRDTRLPQLGQLAARQSLVHC